MSRSRRCSLSLRSDDSKWRWGRRSRRCRLKSLPEELVEEILAWLPVKSLVRFKCVKKSCSLAEEVLFQNTSCNLIITTRPMTTEVFIMITSCNIIMMLVLFLKKKDDYLLWTTFRGRT
nr:hypothetical protein CFP56_12805 [Quercus suber]